MGRTPCSCFAVIQWGTTKNTYVSQCPLPPSAHFPTTSHNDFGARCSEDLNVLVKRHIQTVVSSSPSRALATLENDASELIASGMVTLNAKLIGLDDEKLIGRVVEIWGFFWDQVLTYVEGVGVPSETSSIATSCVFV